MRPRGLKDRVKEVKRKQLQSKLDEVMMSDLVTNEYHTLSSAEEDMLVSITPLRANFFECILGY